jgi:hypothetical protein
MSNPPGEVFNYHSGNPHLLSAIVSKLTGLSARDYGGQSCSGRWGSARRTGRTKMKVCRWEAACWPCSRATWPRSAICTCGRRVAGQAAAATPLGRQDQPRWREHECVAIAYLTAAVTSGYYTKWLSLRLARETAVLSFGVPAWRDCHNSICRRLLLRHGPL